MLIPLLPLLTIAKIADAVEGKDRTEGWFGSIFYSTDILVNVILGGYKRTTISAELGHLRLQRSRGGTIAADFVDWCWELVFKEAHHCTLVMETEDKYFFRPFKAIIGAAIYLATYAIITVSITAAITHNVFI